jgi:hypothetical protein
MNGLPTFLCSRCGAPGAIDAAGVPVVACGHPVTDMWGPGPEIGTAALASEDGGALRDEAFSDEGQREVPGEDVVGEAAHDAAADECFDEAPPDDDGDPKDDAEAWDADTFDDDASPPDGEDDGQELSGGDTAGGASGAAPDRQEAWKPNAPWVIASEVAPKPIAWLWRGRVPLGKATMLDGDPAQGKSTLSIDIAARVTTGAPMPGETEGREPAGVVIVSYEDGDADTIVPRLLVAGADRDRVLIFRLDHPPTIPNDVHLIRDAISQVSAKLVIIDPLMAGLSGKADSYRDQDMRRALQPLAALAEETGAAIVGIRHRPKESRRNAVTSGIGSIGIIGAARAGLLVANDPDYPHDPSRHLLAATKANLSALAPTLRYRTKSVKVRVLATGDVIETVAIGWDGESPLRADDLVAEAAAQGGHGRAAAAADALRVLLADGPVDARAAEDGLKAQDFSEYAIKEAKRHLAVISEHIGDGPTGRWVWRLP